MSWPATSETWSGGSFALSSFRFALALAGVPLGASWIIVSTGSSDTCHCLLGLGQSSIGLSCQRVGLLDASVLVDLFLGFLLVHVGRLLIGSVVVLLIDVGVIPRARR